MIAFHPPLSGFPLACLSLQIVAEALSLFASTRRICSGPRAFLVSSTVLSCLLVFLSGYQASSALGDLSPVAQETLATHHAIARLVVINALLMGAFFFVSHIASHGKRIFIALYGVTLLVQVALTLLVGYHGGALVFTHGLGVASVGGR